MAGKIEVREQRYAVFQVRVPMVRRREIHSGEARSPYTTFRGQDLQALQDLLDGMQAAGVQVAGPDGQCRPVTSLADVLRVLIRECAAAYTE